jgi:CheY-like chemotaxis protein
VSVKTILVAHQSAAVRDRFAAAFADAQHAYVVARDEAEARRAAADAGRPIDLSLVDLGLAGDDQGLALVQALGEAAGRERPVLVFSGSVSSARHARVLTGARIAGFVNEHASTSQILPALAPHLFPDSFNRRASPRVPVEVPISIRAGDAIAGAMTVNVGRGGVGVRTLSPLPLASLVGLTFRLPGAARDVEATGRVAWSDRQLLMGLQFESIDAAGELAIDALSA